MDPLCLQLALLFFSSLTLFQSKQVLPTEVELVALPTPRPTGGALWGRLHSEIIFMQLLQEKSLLLACLMPPC